MKLNPVATSDSIEAMDLMNRLLGEVKADSVERRELIARLGEQVWRHQKALEPLIGTEDLNEEARRLPEKPPKNTRKKRRRKK